MHDACLSLDNAQPTDARPAWDTITLAAYLVVPDETIDEAFAQEFGRSGGFSRIGLFQRALLEDGVVTIDEHATAAEAFFGCVREHGGSVYMSRFDPASHSPTFEYSGSLDADVCDLRYYREVSTYWQVFMSPDWIYGALMDEGRRADLTEIFVVADPSAALSEVSDTIAGLGACLAAQGPIVAGPTSPGHPESRVLSFFAGGADEAAAMLSSCDGASRAHVFEVLPISPASPADVELPPPSPFVQIGLHARHGTLDDGIVTEDEAEQALGLYRSCLSQTGFTVDGLAIDPALADPNAGTAHDGPGGPERGEELRRICALQRLSGTWEIWQAQQAAAP
jgi:hypothetical protein